MTELADRLSRHADLHEHQPWADDEQMQFARDLREAVGLIAELARLRAQEPDAWTDGNALFNLAGGAIGYIWPVKQSDAAIPLYRAAPPAQPAQPLTLVQATAPREIWLQISDEAEHSAEPFPTDHEGITWCQDSVLTCEVKYVRADLAAQPAEPGHVILSAKARRVLGLTEAPAPRVRNKHEALPPACDLFARPLLTRDDFGTAPPMRLGASDALAVPSRGPFRGGAA